MESQCEAVHTHITHTHTYASGRASTDISYRLLRAGHLRKPTYAVLTWKIGSEKLYKQGHFDSETNLCNKIHVASALKYNADH